MGNFDDHFKEVLARQSWTFYGVGMVLIGTRLYARVKKLGIANYQIDDYLMILAAGFYTALIATLNAIAGGGGSNLYPPELEETFTADDVRERIYGSKIVVISEQAMIQVIYTIKACMLVMFSRLTLGLQRDQRLVLYLAYYVAAGWVATEVAFFTACRPFTGYWAVPPPNPQCTTLEHYSIVQGCFNISADVLMLGIPIPLVVRMRLPWRQKIVLMLLFSLGVFVIIAALMTKIFNLTDVYNPNYMLWYIREASVAVYASNLPMIWPLLRAWFPALRKLTPGATASPRYSFKEAGERRRRGRRRRCWFGGGRGGGTTRTRRCTVRLEDTPGKYMTGGISPITPTTGGGGEGDGRASVSVLLPGEGGGDRAIVSPMKGIKEPFGSYDIEMAMTDVDDDHDNDEEEEDDDDDRKSREIRRHLDDSSRSGPRLEGLEAGSGAVYLDAPAKAVMKIDPGSRARVHSAECQFVSVQEQAQQQQQPGRQGGIQVQTTFGVREEQTRRLQAVRPPRSEETGTAW